MPARPPRSRSGTVRFLLATLAAVLCLAATAAGAAWWWVHAPLELERPNVELSVEPGASPREVAQRWVDAVVRTSPTWLYEWFRWSGQARRIRAGSYEVGPGTSPAALLARMVQGDETLETVRVIEGWTVRQMRT
jgi:UPF0755 protein